MKLEFHENQTDDKEKYLFKHTENAWCEKIKIVTFLQN